jgi:dihydroorotase
MRCEEQKMNALLLKNAHLIDPSQGFDGLTDMLIENGHVIDLGPTVHQHPDSTNARHIDVGKQWVLPGLIDLHVHFREPGHTRKETIATGSRAAVAGGFTSVCAMANTFPVNDSVKITKLMMEKAESADLVRYFPIGGVSMGLKGEELADLGLLKQAGCVAFSDDGYPIMNAGLMKRALSYSEHLGVPIVAHEEDLNLSNRGYIHEGEISAALGCLGIPSSAEEVMVARDIILAEETGGHLHVAHVSTSGSLDLIRRAKARGIHVTCEVTPHHFALSDKELLKFDTNYKMSPPLRTKKDIESILEALADGTIDAIATDHAPHGLQDKNIPLPLAAFGIIGLETALPLSIYLLLHSKVISRTRLVELMTYGPARVFNLDRMNLGSLKKGSPADFVIIDPNSKIKVDMDLIRSKSVNTPFMGWELPGQIKSTWIKGSKVWGVTEV